MENYTGKKYVNIKYHINITHDQVSFKITLKNAHNLATLRQTAKRSFGHKTYRYIIYHSVLNILYMPRQIASIQIDFDRQTFGSCLGKLSTSTLIPHCRNFFVLQVYQNTKVVLRHPFYNGADVFIR